ncbi:MAG: Adenylosuccinate synthetase [Verrucomicrobia subdivision 3 bacterium]|nr:Adenylosuccinate synthetase [Limisphaerales bacterium]MCS1412822.1 Adenylosuccinate synthetase [Limisphaerales bacterium]
MASGKSVLAQRLKSDSDCQVIKTSEIIQRHQSRRAKGNRRSLQRKGNELDRNTNHGWIADEVAKSIRPGNGDSPVVLEGVRKPQQVDMILNRIGHRYVRHVHLSVDPATQKQRFQASNRAINDGLDFEAAVKDPSEREVAKLAEKADMVIQTERHTEADVFCRVSARLNLQSRSSDRIVDILVGGQYGSEGKGNIADYLSPEYKILMRVGGPNAGHKVYEEPPYTHISLPCGARRGTEGQELLIGPGAVIEPVKLLQEIRDCEIEPERLTLDEQVVVITPEDREWEEKNLRSEIGSTAQGVGKATARRVTNRFRGDRACKLARDLGPEFRPYLGSTAERLEKAYARGEKILLEGTQGTGLSMFHGLYPSVTSRDTTVSGCLSEAGIGPRRVNRIVLVCRTYPIRVGGNSGNFSKKIDWKTVAERSGISLEELHGHEVGSVSGTRRRVGEFDWELLRRACHLNSPTDIALTFVDYLHQGNREAIRFDQLTPKTIKFVEDIEIVAGVPCSLIGNRFDYKCVIDRRRW